MAEKEGADVSSEPKDKVAEADAKTAKSESVEENAAESPPAVEETDDKKIDPVKKDEFQGRIDKLTRNFRESERTASQLQEENAKLKKQLADAPREPTKSLADFEFDEDKYRDYLFTEAETRAEKVALKAVEGFQEQTKTSNAEEDFDRREKVFADTVKDYDATVHVYDGSLKISPVMATEIKESEIGPEMAYFLGKNPDISAEIAKLPERAAIRRMTLLESELESEKTKAGKKVSDAPPPPPKIPSGDAALEKGYSEGISDAEFAKLRRKEIANR
jgi:hypothetical protein